MWLSVRAPPSDLRYNNALQVGPEVESCVRTQAGELCHHFRTCECDILGPLSQTVVCVFSRGRACACSFYGRFESARAFISQDSEKLKYDIPVMKVFQPPAPRNFSLATFPPQVPVTCQPAQSHLPLLPSLSLTFLPVHTSGSQSPPLFMRNGLAVTRHSLCIPYSQSPFPFRSHICVPYYLF